MPVRLVQSLDMGGQYLANRYPTVVEIAVFEAKPPRTVYVDGINRGSRRQTACRSPRLRVVDYNGTKVGRSVHIICLYVALDGGDNDSTGSIVDHLALIFPPPAGLARRY